MATKYDYLLNKLRVKDSSTGTATIPQYDTDPEAPSANDAWILHTTSGTDGVAGEPRGLLLALTYTGEVGGHSYKFKYQTEEDTTIEVSMT